jgi:multisubunit Na+/H+ antiporter MnhG subunit
MPNAQMLGTILFCILGFCGLLALGAFVGKQTTPGKLVTFAGVIALVAVVLYAMYAAYYFIAET